MIKCIAFATLGFSLAVVPADQAKADMGDAIVGAIIGGILSNAANNKPKQTKRRSTRAASRPRYARGDVEIQKALNHFNCDAGKPDGVFGPRTVRAIKCFQAAIGEQETGKLTAAQTSTLYQAYARDTSTAFAPNAPNAGNSPNGSGGHYDTLLANIGTQSTTSAVIGTAVLTSNEALLATKPQSDEPLAFCQSASGDEPGTSTLKGSSDIDAIASSYCAAVGYAARQSASFMAGLVDFDAKQSASQCNDFADAQRVVIEDALRLEPSAAIESLRTIVPGGELNPALVGSFSICRAISDKVRDEQTARAFSALMAAYGSEGYGELVAATFALGLGTPQSKDHANAWYLWTAEALAGEGEPLIAADDYDHVPLLVALSESALAVTTDWQGYLKQQSSTVQLSEGLALPGLNPSAAPQPVGLPENFVALYGMTPLDALEACRSGGNAILDLGRAACRLVATSFDDTDTLSKYQ